MASTNTTYTEWRYCVTPLLPNQQASSLEIFLPPVFIIILILLGQILLYILTVVNNKHISYEYKDDISEEIKRCTETEECWTLLDDPEFYCDFDHEVLNGLRHSGHDVWSMLILTLPSSVSVVSSCIMYLCYEPMLHCFWPGRARSAPEMNVVISSFVIPAGLVYALSFGFMFQFAMEKYAGVVSKVTTEISLIDQLVTMTAKMKLPSSRHAMALLKAIKAECMCLIVLVQNKRPCDFKNKPPSNLQVTLWQALDILREAYQEKERGYAVNSLLFSKVVKHAVNLNNITTDRMGSLHEHIHLFMWVFLEVLGSITLFSMLLVYAFSHKMELAICHLTLFSVAMLCYVLSDLDMPFTGFFKLDISTLHDEVKRIEGLYASVRAGRPLDISYDRHRDRILQNTPNAI